MNSLIAILLGTVQGLTEFLPISSSGHLVFAESLLGTKASAALTFEVLLHLGTLLAVLIYFRKRISALILGLFPPYTPEKMPKLKYAGVIILATIPAAAIGVVFKDKVEAAFNSPNMVGIFLMITGIVLLSTHAIKKGAKTINSKNGLIIGMAQAVALLPGISRSGMTISAGLFQKVDPAQAAEFSFLLSLPAVFGAAVLKSFQLMKTGLEVKEIDHYLLGMLFAFGVGYLSITWLLKIIKKGQFFYFGIYCLAVGLLGAIFL
jgi:undecaprenyl-diphosphatase